MARIGQNDNSISPQAQAAVKAIREGRTENQRQNRLGMALLSGVAGAGLTGIRAVSENAYENDRQKQMQFKANEKNRAIMQKAIANAKNQAGMRADNTYGGGDAAGPSGSPISPYANVGGYQMDLARGDMQQREANRIDRTDPYSIKSEANDQLDRIAGNEAASKLPLAPGNTRAFDQADQEAQVTGSDINKSMSNIDSAHGMQNSVAAPSTWGGGPGTSDLMQQEDPYKTDKKEGY